MRKVYAGLVVLFLKVGPKLGALALKLVKTAKFTKLGLAGASVATYSYLWTWQFAILILVSIFFHEFGHIWAMKRCGMKTKGIYFIPLLGAAAVSDGLFPSRKAEVYIALMGPVWGCALALLTLVFYPLTGNAFFGAAAAWMALINLFNLLPINPLDGGRVFKSIAFSIHSKAGFLFLGLGMVLCLVFALQFKIGLFAFLLLIGAVELGLEGSAIPKHRKTKERYKDVMLVKGVQNRMMGQTHENVEQQIEIHLEFFEQEWKKGEGLMFNQPGMKGLEIIGSAAVFVVLAAGLVAIMMSVAGIPEVDAAMELMSG